ncbi:MAG TPA: hypothetical protein VGR28_09005 [Candidatus Thermoplasmatota archaeon]|jgi:hypothetical protein|nr:hypothetical protein [Candidatus Thermoplasmatota archaeon]
MRTILAIVLATLLLAGPLAAASTVRTGIIGTQAPLVAPLPAVTSNPLVQNADTHTVTLAPGMRIVAALSWTDTSGLPLANDLDLGLGPPSAPPTPLLPPADPAGALAWTQLTVAATIVRATCSNFVAQSHEHLPTASGAEAIDYTVPAAGESGAYRLTVNGFLVTFDQPYTLAISVFDAGGADVTSSALGAQTYTPFVRTSALCQFILPPP